MSPRAFTILELLVTITIIMVLAGLLLTGVTALRQGARGSRTQAILQLVLQGLETHRSERGGTLTLAQHPLAGSRAPLDAFVRSDGTSIPGGSGLPLVCSELSGLAPAAQAALLGSHLGRTLLDDDRFTAAEAPAFFGLERAAMQVIGLPLPEVTRHIAVALTREGRLPQQRSASGTMHSIGTLVKPGYQLDARQVPLEYADTAADHTARGASDGDALTPDFSDEQRRRTAMRHVLNYLLGQTVSELDRLKGLHETPDDSVANLILAGRLWSPAATQNTLTAPYGTVLIAGAATRYRLRGMAIYDAWGHEVLAQTDRQGGMRLISAGRDGSFVISPGANGRLDTTSPIGGPTGDDGNGARDNLTTSIEVR